MRACARPASTLIEAATAALWPVPCLRLPGNEPAPFGLRLSLGNQITLETGFGIHRPQTATMSIISRRLIDCRSHK